MVEILNDFRDIYIKYPFHKLFKKEDKKQRHIVLSAWKNTEYEVIPNIDEIIEFSSSLEGFQLKHDHIFMEKVLAPCVLRDIEAGDLKSLLYVFSIIIDVKLMDGDSNSGYRHYTVNGYNSPLSIICAVSKYKYEPLELANKVLEISPADKATLESKYALISSSIGFSLHELPTYVICNDLEVLASFKIKLNILKELSKKLNKNDADFLELCTVAYDAYGDYLEHSDQYKNFEKYIAQHKLYILDPDL